MRKKAKGPTKAQLLARVERLESALRHYQRGDVVRQDGEHWYRLVDYFDPDEIRRIPRRLTPWDQPAFLLGMLSDKFVIEHPKGASDEDVAKFLKVCRTAGLAPALAVRPGIRFLRIATVSSEEEARIDAALTAERADAQKLKETKGAEVIGAGSESSGDRLGSDLPQSAYAAGCGSDRNEADLKAGETASDSV